MDKKDLEQDEAKDKRGTNIRYDEIEVNTEPMFVRETVTNFYHAERIYTYKDYLNWPEDERVELIDGKIYYMSAPTKKHQQLLGSLYQRFSIYLHGKTCEVYMAPFDVRIDLEYGKDSVVQPDLVVICDTDKLDDKGLNGSPDLVIEVLSPSNVNHDTVRKYNKYLAVGVKEYWMVNPMKEEVIVNVLENRKYSSKTYFKGDIITASCLKDFAINVTDLFEGYQGDEIVEVETARAEERAIAETRRVESAKSMIADGLAFATISKYTNLSVEEIKQLATTSD